MRTIFGLLIAAAEGSVPFNGLIFDLTHWLFGTSDGVLGGLDIPLSSRLLGAIGGIFQTNGPHIDVKHPDGLQRHPTCLAFYAANPKLQRRWSQLEANNPSDQQWISLVEDPDQLMGLSDIELQCLVHLGYAPKRIFLGQIYGRVVSMFSGGLTLDIGQAFWGGKTVIQTRCPSGKVLAISSNNIGSGQATFAHVSIRNNPFNPQVGFEPNETIDTSHPWMFVDYTEDFTRWCGEENTLPRHYMSSEQTKLRTNPNTLISDMIPDTPRLTGAPGVGLIAPNKLAAGIFDNAWPVRQIVDRGRWVGRDEEQGMDIYLWQSLLVLPEGARSILWFNVKSADLVDEQIVH